MAAKEKTVEQRLALLEKLARANGWSFPGDKRRPLADPTPDEAE